MRNLKEQVIFFSLSLKHFFSHSESETILVTKYHYPILNLMNLFYELGEIFSLTCQKNYVFFVQILSPLKEISFESSFRFITIKFSHKLNAYEAKNKFRQTRAWDVLLVLTKVSKMVRFLQISKYKKLYYSFLSRSWVFPESIPSGSWVIPEWFLSPSRVYSYVSNRRVYPLIIFRNFPSYLLKYFTTGHSLHQSR